MYMIENLFRIFTCNYIAYSDRSSHYALEHTEICELRNILDFHAGLVVQVGSICMENKKSMPEYKYYVVQKRVKCETTHLN